MNCFLRKVLVFLAIVCVLLSIFCINQPLQADGKSFWQADNKLAIIKKAMIDDYLYHLDFFDITALLWCSLILATIFLSQFFCIENLTKEIDELKNKKNNNLVITSLNNFFTAAKDKRKRNDLVITPARFFAIDGIRVYNLSDFCSNNSDKDKSNGKANYDELIANNEFSLSDFLSPVSLRSPCNNFENKETRHSFSYLCMVRTINLKI